jgi:polysaccharide transporter, PST family
MRYGGFVASVGTARLIGVLISAVTFPYIVRRLGVETYGMWSYVIAVCAFVDQVANPGLLSHAGRQVAARRLQAADEVADILMLRALLAVLAAGVVIVVAALEIRQDVSRLLLLYGLCILAVNLVASDYLLSALEMFHQRSILAVIQQSLYAAGIFLFVRSPANVQWVPISILVSSLMTNLAGWVLLYRTDFRPGLRFRPHRWWPILVPSGHYALASLMSNLYHRTGHILIRWMLGAYDLGLYAAATRLVDILRNFLGVFHSVLLPRMAMSSESMGTLRRLMRLAVAVLALLGFPLFIGIVVTGPLIVPRILGAQYLESARLLPWLALYVIAASAATLFSGTALYAIGRYREYLVSTIAGAIVGVICYVVLIPLLGLRGACVAFVLGEVGVAVTAYRLIPAEARTIWHNPLLGVAVVSSAVMGALIVFLRWRGVAPLVLVIVGTLVYAAASTLLGLRSLRREFQPTH